MGQEEIETIACDTASNHCSVTVPAPGVALVFLTDTALSEVENSPTTTFYTTALTKTRNTATIDPSVLATSNGHRAIDQKGNLGSTSKGSANGAAQTKAEIRLGVCMSLISLASAIVSLRVA